MAKAFKVNDVDLIFINEDGNGSGAPVISNNGLVVSAAGNPLNIVGDLSAVNDLIVPGQVNIGLIRQIFGGAGNAGDTIVFDALLTEAAGAPGFRAMKNGGFDGNTAFIVGWARTAFLGNGDFITVQNGGLLPPAVTGLTGANAGQLTVNTATGRIVVLTGGATLYGLCDGNGNAYMLQVAQLPVGL